MIGKTWLTRIYCYRPEKSSDYRCVQVSNLNYLLCNTYISAIYASVSCFNRCTRIYAYIHSHGACWFSWRFCGHSVVSIRCLSGTCLVLVIYRIVTARMSREMQDAFAIVFRRVVVVFKLHISRSLNVFNFFPFISRRPANVGGCEAAVMDLIDYWLSLWQDDEPDHEALVIVWSLSLVTKTRTNHSLELLYAHSFHF